jgi:hypothetical protein
VTALLPASEREAALLHLYRLERRAGSDPLTANEAVHDFGKRLDALEEERHRDLPIIRQCLARTS